MNCDLLPTERVAIVVSRLKDGERLAPSDVARLTGITPDGAWRMLRKISRKLPLLEEDGVWFLLTD